MPYEFDFALQQEEWSKVPNDVDYFDPAQWLELSDEVLREQVQLMERNRYSSWRNWNGLWREYLGLDATHDQTILDFGCGTGIEALQFAKLGNDVIVADINEASSALAQRVLQVCGYEGDAIPIQGSWPYVTPDRPLDVFYANGVLHHTPEAIPILKRATELLRPSGEVRLLLYSDRGWRIATHTNPPVGDPRLQPSYERFLRYFDSVGFYSEPWWEEKLAGETRAFLELVSWRYLCADGRYAVAILKKPA